ncbi:heterogeneous nuclear ribonucleoprotein L-like protein [Leptotrombidium deliense]|uniref:Heterogeneous nuclear ribonucleoprotein L-like protein n=1 Tax=Leptotrombidium deliense TaxID=299467 RepID=A0A443STD2_9ACAR|nr:heterogeneous nuclear ribonucleoprotein L-like protein [Leptotrombidium deliense]
MATYEGHSAKRIKTDEVTIAYIIATIHLTLQDRNYNNPSYYGHTNSRYGGHPRNDERENHVLLITVINPAYPITCDVIHQICSPQGKVMRVVIFKKNGVQAMVEFDSVDSAKRAKQALHGCDIYSGCCTLRIEFAKPTRLNVYKNDNESFDYTNPSLGMGNNRNNINAASHQGNYAPDHSETAFHEGYGAAPRPPAPQSYVDPYMQHPPSDPYRDGRAPVLPTPPAPGFGGAPPPPPPGGGGAPPPMMTGQPPPPTGAPQQGAVMMVYGLDHDKMNAERLFNLFCLYGNVVRVKFLKSKEGCAMVQMGDPVAVERCINSLNNLTFFGKKMQLSYSKQAFLNDVQQPFELQDGTPSFKDFMGNRNNRFTNPEAASKNRIAPPAKVLHFFNAPHGMTDDEIISIFKSTGGPVASGVKLFQSKTERSSSGLIQFESVAEAVEALVLCNHISIPNPSGKFPFVFKLCFSSTGSRF